MIAFYKSDFLQTNLAMGLCVGIFYTDFALFLEFAVISEKYQARLGIFYNRCRQS